MSVGISAPERPNKLESTMTLADLSKIALPSRTRRIGTLRRRVKSGRYWVAPQAISRQITDFYWMID